MSKLAHLYGYFSVATTILANLALLPFVLRILNADQVGLWFNYLTLYALVMRLDFGISGNATRELGKAWAFNSKDPKLAKFQYSALLNEIKPIYAKIGYISFAVSFCAVSPYLLYVANYEGGIRDVLISWPLSCLGLLLAMRFLYFPPALRSLGRIQDVYVATILSKLTQFFSTIIMLYAGAGLASVSIGFLIGIVASRWSMKRTLRQSTVFWNNPTAKLSRQGILEFRKKTGKLGIMSLATFFQDKALIFYVTLFVGLSAAKDVGLFIQIFSAIAGFANVYYNTHQNSLIQKIVVEGHLAARRPFLSAAFVQAAIILAGAFSLYFLWPLLALVLGETIDRLPVWEFALLSLYFLTFNFTSICINYLIITDDFSVFKPSILSACLFGLLAYLYSTFHGGTILSLLTIQLCVLLIFHGFRWPVRLFTHYWS